MSMEVFANDDVQLDVGRCIHTMIREWCAICNNVLPDEKTHRVASYASRCICGERIYIGDFIHRNEGEGFWRGECCE